MSTDSAAARWAVSILEEWGEKLAAGEVERLAAGIVKDSLGIHVERNKGVMCAELLIAWGGPTARLHTGERSLTTHWVEDDTRAAPAALCEAINTYLNEVLP